MCVRKSGGGKKNRGRGGLDWGGGCSRRVHCGHANVVDHKQGHKDVMKLNIQKPSVPGPSHSPFPFQTVMTLVPHKFGS